ncbi:hypothetical protein B0A58_13485, partial [Flavobacterium branchiophilum NBRC 15030 = ATCC 35035]|uniref:hypothetical protein n=1 Tax=Flavobacterium branchiophilum TaxID=55197 RepID=UPI000B71D634
NIFGISIAVEILLEAPQLPKGVLHCMKIVSECGNQKRLFHNIIFLLEFNERCMKRKARPLGNAKVI